MTRRLRTISAVAAGALAAAVLGACGGDGGVAVSGVAGVMPADAAVYAEVTIKPEGAQKENAEALIAQLGEVPLLGQALDPRQLAEQAIAQLAEQNDADISYAEDFEPWLGERAAIAYLPQTDYEDPDFVLAIETSDEAIARDSLARISAADAALQTDAEYDGVAYQVGSSGDYAVGVFDGVLVLATASQFERAVDSSRGDSLADSGEFQESMAQLDDERLAALYVDPEAVAEAAVATTGGAAALDAIRNAAPELVGTPVVASLAAGEGSAIVDLAFGRAPDLPDVSGAEVLAGAPGDAFAALALGRIGEIVDAVLVEAEASGQLDRESLEASLGLTLEEATQSVGDAVLYGRGKIPGNFSVTLDLTLPGDSDAPLQLLNQLGDAFAAQTETRMLPPLDGDGTGFAAEATGAAADEIITFFYAEMTDELVRLTLASDREAVAAPAAGTLGDDESFQRADAALGDFAPLAYADLGPILDAVFAGSSPVDVITGEATPEQAMISFLAGKLDFAVLGTRADDDRQRTRLVVALD